MRNRPPADDYRPHRPTVAEQVESLPMFAVPAPSQPRRGSEASADQIQASGRLPSIRFLALYRLAKGPATADQVHRWMIRQQGRARLPLNSVAPRLTELTGPGPTGEPYAEYDDSQENVSQYGGPNCPYRITVAGLQVLRELMARMQTKGGSFEDTTERALP